MVSSKNQQILDSARCIVCIHERMFGIDKTMTDVSNSELFFVVVSKTNVFVFYVRHSIIVILLALPIKRLKV